MGVSLREESSQRKYIYIDVVSQYTRKGLTGRRQIPCLPEAHAETTQPAHENGHDPTPQARSFETRPRGT